MPINKSILLAGLMAAALPGAAFAEGDATAGKAIFQKCSLCHYAEAGKTKIGPSLWGVVGRKAGTEPGYSYSDAMKSFGKTWTDDELFVYLAGPQKVVPGTKMAFAGLPSETDRHNVIAYLDTLK
jgi:cytochrome c